MAVVEYPSEAVQDVDSPGVIVDFGVVGDLLFVAVANIGPEPAYDIAVTFDHAFRGLGGERVMNELPLFSRLRFLAPGREIRTLLDATAAYFARREPARLAATVSYRLPGGRHQRATIHHDLTVFRDLTPLPKGNRHGRR